MLCWFVDGELFAVELAIWRRASLVFLPVVFEEIPIRVRYCFCLELLGQERQSQGVPSVCACELRYGPLDSSVLPRPGIHTLQMSCSGW